MRVFNWAVLPQPSWFISDGIHYTSAGYAKRAQYIADGLAEAFPLLGKSSTCLVSLPSSVTSQPSPSPTSHRPAAARQPALLQPALRQPRRQLKSQANPGRPGRSDLTDHLTAAVHRAGCERSE
jgi:hypothetical protein